MLFQKNILNIFIIVKGKFSPLFHTKLSTHSISSHRAPFMNYSIMGQYFNHHEERFKLIFNFCRNFPSHPLNFNVSEWGIVFPTPSLCCSAFRTYYQLTALSACLLTFQRFSCARSPHFYT